ncbi:MAG: hypothetical protein ACFFE4_00460 [Candidatus Thorarchaeota archaeon]
MKVQYNDKPKFLIYKGFSGEVKKGDILEMDEKTFKEYASLDLIIIEKDKINKKSKKWGDK